MQWELKVDKSVRNCIPVFVIVIMLFAIATETNQMHEMFQSGGGSVMVNSSANNY